MISIFIPSSGTIDVNENENFPITLNIADIRNPDKRNANYTKTIKLPGTANNNQIFGWLFDVNVIANRFNPNHKVPCVVLDDSIPILEGNIQLLSIDVKDQKNITYECTVMGNTVDLFTNIGDGELKDLDLSSYNHVFNYGSIYNSWTSPVGSGYVYPQIDYGIYDVQNLIIEDDFKPSIYAKTYIDAIINEAGFTHSSTFLNSDFFKRLIVPFNGDYIRASQTTAQNARVVASVQGTKLTSTDTGAQQVLALTCNTETTDPLNQYNGTTITIAATGWYRLKVSSKYSFKYTSTTAYSSLDLYTQISKNLTTGILNDFMKISDGSIPNAFFNGLLTSPTAGDETSSFWSISDATFYFLAGDVIRIRAFMNNAGTDIKHQYETGSNIELTLLTESEVSIGTELSIINAIPDKVKQKDFLMGIINHFNLYIDIDKSNPKRLLIETRDDFYSNGTIVDWSNKWDSERGWIISPMGSLDANQYDYTYKDDNDYYNDDYKKKWNLTYGKREWKIDNDYVKNTKKTEVLFSPTPLVKRLDRVFSTIIKKDSSGNYIKSKHNIRLLYYGGLKSCLPFNIKVKSGGLVSSNVSSYAYAGHLDDPNWPTLDLNFGSPKEVYYSINPFIYTDNNSFNRFYKNFIEEITDSDNKIIEGYFNLSPYDLSVFDFRNKVFVDNAYWRVLKIDFDPTKDDLAKIELVKIKNIPTFVPSSGISYSSSGETFLPYDYNPVSRQGAMFGDNHLVRGYNIFVADNAINVIATGEYITIGNSKNVSVLNSSGVVVAGGLTNVHVVNSSGITVTESNISYINSVIVSQSNVTPAQILYTSGTILSSQINTSYTSPIVLIPGVSGYIIEPIDCVMYCDYTSAHTLTFGSTVEINWSGNTIGGGVAPIYQVAAQSPGDFPLLGETGADYYARLVPVSLNVSPAYSVKALVGSSLVMGTSVANPTGGNIRLNYHITYRLIGF